MKIQESIFKVFANMPSELEKKIAIKTRQRRKGLTRAERLHKERERNKKRRFFKRLNARMRKLEPQS